MLEKLYFYKFIRIFVWAIFCTLSLVNSDCLWLLVCILYLFSSYQRNTKMVKRRDFWKTVSKYLYR